jgi:tripartite-type tricarboxylate transporter receptor subunit TctC
MIPTRRLDMILRRLATRMAAALLLLVAVNPLHAQTTWPAKPLRIVVGFAPGGGTDMMARIVAQSLGELLGQSVIVENKPGASGNIAAAEVIRAAADGYTLYVAPTTVQSANPLLFKSSINMAKDLSPLAAIGRMQLHLVVRHDSPFKDMRDLLAYARDNPGKLSYASSGPGTTPHLITEVLLQQTGLNMVHVPYRGAGPSLQAVLAGETSFVLDPGIAFQHVRAGKLRMLAVASGRRSPSFPDVPTMGELGVPGLDLDTWFGIWVPTGTPAEITNRLDEALAKVLAQPVVRQRFADMMAEATHLDAADFRNQLDRETRALTRVITERKISLD